MSSVRYTRRVLHAPREVPKHTAALREHFAEKGAEDVKAYLFDGCRCIVAREPIEGRLRWHLSVQREDRWPDLEEIMHARLALLPIAKTCGIVMPSEVDLQTTRHYQIHVHELPEVAASW